MPNLKKMPTGIYLDANSVIGLWLGKRWNENQHKESPVVHVRFRDSSNTEWFFLRESTIDQWAEALNIGALGTRFV